MANSLTAWYRYKNCSGCPCRFPMLPCQRPRAAKNIGFVKGILGKACPSNETDHLNARHSSAPVLLHSGGGCLWPVWFPKISHQGKGKYTHGTIPAGHGLRFEKAMDEAEHGRLRTRVSEKMTA